MQKPKEILEFEKKYGLTLREASDKKDFNDFNRKNLYLTDDKRQVIGLNLRNNRFKEVPDLSFFPNLQYLNLSDNEISEIKGLDGLGQLTYLYLSGNQISEIKGLVGLSQLRNLYLYDNKIKGVKGLKGLQLTSLSLYNNQINEIKELELLPQLTSLYLGKNKISEIKGLERLEKLINLYLSENQISDIKGLEGLVQLTDLDLSDNQISEIKGLEGLSQLTDLDLSENQISEIKGLEGLEQLTELYLGENQIIDISPLRFLIEKGFDIDIDIDSDFMADNVIDLGGNPLEDSLISILNIEDKQEKRKALLDYLANKKLGERPFREAKLMLLGEGEAGKTNFRNYIMGLPFEQAKSATTGIAIDRKNVTIQGNDYRVNVWDFGGQWIQQQLHKFFITDESIYIIILNARNSEEPTKWLKWIKSYTTDSKAFVVVNKMDDNFSHQLVENKLKEEYPFIEGFYYISLRDAAQNKANAKQLVDSLWQAIQQCILTLKNIESPVASNYHNLKNDLEDNYLKDKNYIDFSTYEKLFKKHKVLGDKETLLKVLEKIGTVRYFSTFDKLILNPEWLSGGVYKILMSEKASKEQFGILKEADLKAIMCETRNERDKFPYRDAEQSFIIQMMKDFELAYIDSAEKTYFIPSLFKPDIPADLSKEAVYHYPDVHFTFEFKHAAFPEELISKFIVRFFEKKYKAFYWKNGILLIDKDDEFDKSIYAYIESDKDNRTLTIKMKGEHSRTFFKDIKKQIKDLLANTNFEYDEWLIHPEHKIKLNYKEYVVFYNKGKTSREEVSNGELYDINIAEVLGLVNDQKDLESMKKESKIENHYHIEQYNDFRESQNKDAVIGSKNFTKSTYKNIYKNSPEVVEIKTMLQSIIDNSDLKEIKEFQDKWLGEFNETLKYIIELEQARSKEEEDKAKSALKTFFEKGKKLNDWKDIVGLPIAIVELVGKYSQKIPDFLNYLQITS